MKIRDYLSKYKLLTDGSFGTYYSDKYASQEMPERANLTNPERVVEIHREYVEAGARLLRTNSFASDTALLEADWGEVERNLKAAVSNARTAIKEAGTPGADPADQVFIAGDIGPIPAGGFADIRGIEEEYYLIARTLLDEGLGILVFETFPELEHILPAIRRIRREYGPELFIIVQFAINQFGYSSAGLSQKRLLQEAAKVDEIDAIGFNCGVGPAHMCQLLEKLRLPTNKYLTTLPNAGYPKLNRNQIQFGNTPSYFAMKMADLSDLGSDILGGCCGTNPSFIRKLSEMLDFQQKPKKQADSPKTAAACQPSRKGFLYQEDGSRKPHKLIAVELAPPFDANDEKLLESAHILMQSGVDVLTFPDSPSGRTRIDSVLMAEKVRRETGLCVMPHICCRDKNAVAMRSMLLGADINDIHNLLIITGDPLPSMVRQTVKAVFNFDSVGLMNIVKEMNEDTFAKTPMCYGGAINQGRKNLDVEIARVKRKMEAGAEFFLTQPVFGPEDVSRLRRIKNETSATILCGIMPLVSKKNALFMKNEISGVNVPDQLIDRYPEAGSRQENEAVGIAMAKEMIAATADFADGYYFTFPFNRVYLLKEIMEGC